MIRRRISPIPMGRIPGFLLSAISLQATNLEMVLGSTKVVHSRQVILAKAWAKASDSRWKVLLHNKRAHNASVIPLGPVPPLVVEADLRIASMSMLSNSAGSTLGARSRDTMRSRFSGSAGGVFVLKAVNHIRCRGKRSRGRGAQHSQGSGYPALHHQSRKTFSSILTVRCRTGKLGLYDNALSHQIIKFTLVPGCESPLQRLFFFVWFGALTRFL